MGITSGLGRVVLVIVNMLILLLSIAIIICGIIVVAGKDIYNKLLDTFRDTLEKALKEMGVVDIDTSNLSFTEVMLPLAYGVIALGVIMGCLSLLGCIGGCCSSKIVLFVYVIITAGFFLIEVAIVIVVYVDKNAFDGVTKPNIKRSLKRFSDIEGTEPETLAWNALMSYGECCGVDSYKDFEGLEKWPPKSIRNQTVNLETPVMCCKKHTKDFSCAEKNKVTDDNNWHNTGCYDKLFDMVVKNAFVISIIAIMLAFQFIMVFITLWILCTMDNKIL